LSIDEEIAGIQDELEDIEKTLTNLFSLITQLDYEQEVINEEKRQEEIARIQMEDQMWYQEYEKIQEDFNTFMANFEEKKDEFQER